MTEAEETDLRIRLSRLRERHRDLDHAIGALERQGGQDLQIRRLKKEKLTLKDGITRLENLLMPDLIA